MNRFISSFVAASLSLAAPGLASATEVTLGNLKIAAPYVRAMVPGAEVGGGYVTITNSGRTDDRLIAASSSRAVKVEVHEMKMDNDVMVMRKLKNGLALPAGKTVQLKPGSYHLMFMDVIDPFKQGETIRAKLTFEKAGSIDVDFPVGSAVASKADNGGEHANAAE
ncbi:copper chaperone PCu(A)C [Rhizobium sp. RCAM05973]|uniref:copper chaperone PCu(A)C n=1 Tax=Rhizobium sp. RCAM05973 TaxID=2994066 RepID=UPI0022EC0BBB|nr:copper chaperone PCu(A)C [Rhizobium sp. RCAM05973]